MSALPLMPKATAVWLVDNTALSFDQIAEFCGLHQLEVKGIADGDVATGIKGMDPISSGQLTRDEIKRGETKPAHKLKISVSNIEIPKVTTKRGPRYTPVSRRQDRPNALLWLLKNHPELKDSQIMRLVGTTKPTIKAVRERSHWNSQNLQPLDPVTLGLSSQTELDAEVNKAAKRVAREAAAAGIPLEKVGTLLPAAQTTGIIVPEEPTVPEVSAEVLMAQEEARMLEKLKGMSGDDALTEAAPDADTADTVPEKATEVAVEAVILKADDQPDNS